MSSDQQCEKHCRRKLKGFEARLILFNMNLTIHNKTAPKSVLPMLNLMGYLNLFHFFVKVTKFLIWMNKVFICSDEVSKKKLFYMPKNIWY